MIRTSEIVLASALAISSITPVSFAQSTTRSGASTIVGSAGARSQTSSSTFLGSMKSGRSSWQAGNGSFGQDETLIGTRTGLVDSNKQPQAGSTATLVAARGESAHSKMEKLSAIQGLKTEAPAPQSTATTVLAKRSAANHKKRLPPQMQLGVQRMSGNTAHKSGLLSDGGAKTGATGAYTNASSVK